MRQRLLVDFQVPFLMLFQILLLRERTLQINHIAVQPHEFFFRVFRKIIINVFLLFAVVFFGHIVNFLL